MEEQICNRYYDLCNKKEQVSELKPTIAGFNSDTHSFLGC